MTKKIMPRKKAIIKSKSTNNTTISLKTDVYNIQGEVVGKTSLPAEIFAAIVSPQLLSQAVRVYQANERAGTHNTKTRSEVAGSTRKIYKQKGTGRARHGSITAPIFIGGGVAHGPHPIDYSMTLPQNMKKKALFGVLTDKLQSNTIKVVRGMENIELKTKKMNEVLENLKLTPSKGENSKILLVTSQNKENISLAGRNIPYLTIGNAKLLNSYEVMSHGKVLLMEEAVPVLAGHFISKGKTEETLEFSSRKKETVPPPKKAAGIIKSKKKIVKVSVKSKSVKVVKKTVRSKKLK